MSSVMVLLTVGACGNDVPSPSSTSASATPSTSATDLSAIACATEDPEGVGRLTGVWAGSEGGMYYVRQVGDCIWWFGTDVRDIEPGLTDQPGFANVASGRISGDRIDLEWADLPLGDTLGGGGLTLVYDAENDQLTKVEQRGDWLPFGATTFTRIEPDASPQASPSPLPSAGPVSLEVAKQRAPFVVRMPAALGPPERVEIADPDDNGVPRVVSALYRGGTVRFDQFDGSAGAFFKQASEAEWVELGGDMAIWLPGPHTLTYVDRTGAERSATARLATPTLIWERGQVTYRLEGFTSRDEARAAALSLS